jgi:hypothetical protein
MIFIISVNNNLWSQKISAAMGTSDQVNRTSENLPQQDGYTIELLPGQHFSGWYYYW